MSERKLKRKSRGLAASSTAFSSLRSRVRRAKPATPWIEIRVPLGRSCHLALLWQGAGGKLLLRYAFPAWHVHSAKGPQRHTRVLQSGILVIGGRRPDKNGAEVEMINLRSASRRAGHNAHVL